MKFWPKECFGHFWGSDSLMSDYLPFWGDLKRREVGRYKVPTVWAFGQCRILQRSAKPILNHDGSTRISTSVKEFVEKALHLNSIVWMCAFFFSLLCRVFTHPLTHVSCKGLIDKRWRRFRCQPTTYLEIVIAQLNHPQCICGVPNFETSPHESSHQKKPLSHLIVLGS